MIAAVCIICKRATLSALGEEPKDRWEPVPGGGYRCADRSECESLHLQHLHEPIELNCIRQNLADLEQKRTKRPLTPVEEEHVKLLEERIVKEGRKLTHPLQAK